MFSIRARTLSGRLRETESRGYSLEIAPEVAKTRHGGSSEWPQARARPLTVQRGRPLRSPHLEPRPNARRAMLGDGRFDRPFAGVVGDEGDVEGAAGLDEDACRASRAPSRRPSNAAGGRRGRRGASPARPPSCWRRRTRSARRADDAASGFGAQSVKVAPLTANGAAPPPVDDRHRSCARLRARSRPAAPDWAAGGRARARAATGSPSALIATNGMSGAPRLPAQGELDRGALVARPCRTGVRSARPGPIGNWLRNGSNGSLGWPSTATIRVLAPSTRRWSAARSTRCRASGAPARRAAP